MPFKIRNERIRVGGKSPSHVEQDQYIKTLLNRIATLEQAVYSMCDARMGVIDDHPPNENCSHKTSKDLQIEKLNEIIKLKDLQIKEI